MIEQTEIAVIIPTYNRYKVTKAMLELLAIQTNQNFTTIIVDSGSVDRTKDLAADNDCIILDVGSEVWWTGAIEHGVNYVLKHKFKWILILNDDIEFGPNFIEYMLQTSKDNPNAINIPSQKEMSGSIFNGFKLSSFFKKRQRVMVGEYCKSGYSIDVGNGCALIFPIHIIEKVWLFENQKCPHYGGDVYLFLTAKNAGFDIKVHPNILISQTSATSPLKYISISTIFTSKGSIFHFQTHITLGLKIYGSMFNFCTRGVIYNYTYIKRVTSTICLLWFKKE